MLPINKWRERDSEREKERENSFLKRALQLI